MTRSFWFELVLHAEALTLGAWVAVTIIREVLAIRRRQARLRAFLQTATIRQFADDFKQWSDRVDASFERRSPTRWEWKYMGGVTFIAATVIVGVVAGICEVSQLWFAGGLLAINALVIVFRLTGLLPQPIQEGER